jgi:hypothetical protein
MIQAGTSSQQRADIHNSDQLLPTAAGSAVTTTQVTVASVVLVAVVHIPVALPEQVLQVKETQAVTLLVVEVVPLAAVVAAPEVWVLQETLLKDRVVQERQLLLPEVQSRMQVAAVVVVGM